MRPSPKISPRFSLAVAALSVLVAAPLIAAPAKTTAPAKATAPAKSLSTQKTSATALNATALNATAPSVAPLSEEQKIRHALNRLGYGARPGDVERIRKIGLSQWMDDQLHPERLNDAAVEEKLASLRKLSLSNSELFRAFEAGRSFQRILGKRRKANEAAAAQANAEKPDATNETAMNANAMEMDANAMDAAAMDANAMDAPLSTQREGKRRRNLRSAAMPNAAMPNAVMGRAANANAVISLAALTDEEQASLRPQQRELFEEAERKGTTRNFSGQAVGELIVARLVRAVESEKQLNEVMVDFWSNHFNVDVRKGAVEAHKIADERDVIRPHIWGKFRDLLGASAHSPAMLFYLDNFRSTVAPDETMSTQKRRPDAKKPMRRRVGGVNENYARELMELHTLGVDGGYTQKDVQEVARCLTGWGIDPQTGDFTFRARVHDNGEKTVLGKTIAAGGGEQDAERVLDMLATHPSTARHLARKLCLRLVSDNPSYALVKRVADKFLKTDGDLRETVRAVIESPEFFAAENYQKKTKSPYEYAVSAVRALGGTMDLQPQLTPENARANPPRNRRRANVAPLYWIAVSAPSLYANRPVRVKTLAASISTMGQPLFAFQAPTGYSEKSDSWVSAGALVARLNYALDVAGGAVVDVDANPTKLTQGLSGDDAGALIDRLGETLLGGKLSASTRATLEKQIAPGTPPSVTKISALLLGSPEFQRR